MQVFFLKKQYFICLSTCVFITIYLLNIMNLPVDESPISCGRLPQEQDIIIDHVIWQAIFTPQETFRILNAYYDDRQNETIVRISMLAKKIVNNSVELYCQFWLNENPDTIPIVVKATQYIRNWPDYYQYEDGHKVPYLVTCPINFQNRIPVAVSLTHTPCEHAHNKLKVINNQPVGGVKKGFGVCCKFVYVYDRAEIVKFLEWVHMLLILGADKIYFTNIYVHPELFKLLNYYVEIGRIEFTDFLEPSGLLVEAMAVNLKRLFGAQQQMIETLLHTDCFYRIRNLYEFISVLDVDELIIPTNSDDYTWHDLVKRFDYTQNYVGFQPANLIMPHLGLPPHPDIPEYHYMLQHTMRYNLTNKFTKPLFLPEDVISVYIHSPMWCFHSNRSDNWCNMHLLMPEDVALVYHFRKGFNKDLTENNSTRTDTTMWKYKDDLIREVAVAMNATGFKP